MENKFGFLKQTKKQEIKTSIQLNQKLVSHSAESVLNFLGYKPPKTLNAYFTYFIFLLLYAKRKTKKKMVLGFITERKCRV